MGNEFKQNWSLRSLHKKNPPEKMARSFQTSTPTFQFLWVPQELLTVTDWKVNNVFTGNRLTKLPPLPRVYPCGRSKQIRGPCPSYQTNKRDVTSSFSYEFIVIYFMLVLCVLYRCRTWKEYVLVIIINWIGYDISLKYSFRQDRTIKSWNPYVGPYEWCSSLTLREVPVLVENH